MIKIAYLIEAHTDIDRLISLCEALKESGDIYIHIDKKNKNQFFWEKLIDYEINNKQVFILEKQERYYVAWAGFSQVKCFESLLKRALSEKQYDRFLLLSGLDYPVWSPTRIRKFFEENNNLEFVCGYDISTCTDKKQLRKIEYYHFFRDIPLPHKSFFRRAFIGGTMLLLKCLGFKRRPYFYDGKNEWHIFFGSSWIAITRQCAEYILSKLRNKNIRRYFSSVYAPDELCVPTIVMNSRFRDNALKIKKFTFQNATPLHYLNYEGYIWSYDENDYNTIIQSNKMFVRKVVSGKSEKLVELIRNSWNSN